MRMGGAGLPRAWQEGSSVWGWTRVQGDEDQFPGIRNKNDGTLSTPLSGMGDTPSAASMGPRSSACPCSLNGCYRHHADKTLRPTAPRRFSPMCLLFGFE